MPWVEKYQTKRGPHWRVGWRDNNKRRYQVAGPYKALAIKKKDEITKRLLGGGFLINKTIKDCIAEYLSALEKTKRPRTKKITQYALNPFLAKYGSLELSKIHTTELERFKNSLLESGRNTNGINVVIRNIKSLYNYAVKAGYLEISPARNLKQFKPNEVARFLTRSDLAKLYMKGSKRLRRAIAVLVYTGMRVGEFTSLKSENIKGDHIIIKQTKTGKPRIIPIPKRIKKFLLNSLEQWSLDYIEKAFRKASRGAKIGRVRLHDLRHTFASSYLQSGGTIADLKEITGHKSLTSLEIYTHFQHSYLAERINKVRI